jgi:hypothetical protein
MTVKMAVSIIRSDNWFSAKSVKLLRRIGVFSAGSELREQRGKH